MIFVTLAKVLIDCGATDNFLSSSFLHKLNQKPKKLEKCWLVEFASGQKCHVKESFPDATLSLPNFDSEISLHIVSLLAFEIILGLDWLKKVRAKVDFSEHWVKVQNHSGKKIKLNSIKTSFNFHPLFASQFAKVVKNKCQCLTIRIHNKNSETKVASSYSIFEEFANVFLDELPGMPLEREFDFSIDLIPVLNQFQGFLTA